MEEGQSLPGIEGAGTGADGEPELRNGTIIAGKYRVDRSIGRGGMGVVLGATSLASGERVAIKVLHADALGNAEAVARFEREALAAARMNGDHAARVLDVGTLESGAPYIVMEYLEGEDLAQILKRRGQLPIAEAVDYVAQACEALAQAHAAGIVHRDLKPGNLFLAAPIVDGASAPNPPLRAVHDAGSAPEPTPAGSPRIKILDFGISKMSDQPHDGSDSTLTTTHSFLGSPVYMSPEQMAAPKKVDARTDIWALGVTLYRLLTCQVPFSGESPMAMCSIILSGARPVPVRKLREDVPEELDRAILHCLEREPADRVQSVAELALAIAPFGTATAALAAKRAQEHLAASSAPAPSSDPILPPLGGAAPGADSIETLAVGTLATWSRSRTRPRRTSQRTLALVGAAAALLTAALFAFRATHSAANPHGVPAESPGSSSEPASPAGAAAATPAATQAPSGAAPTPSALAVALASAAPLAASAPPAGKRKTDGSTAGAAVLARDGGSASRPPASASALPGGVFGGTPF